MARILIVEARFYDHLNDLLLAGARAAIEEGGHRHETVTVPGALEVPGAMAMAAGGSLLPYPVRVAMRVAADVMRTVAYRV